MLSLPAIKEFIKSRHDRRYERRPGPAFFIDPGAAEQMDTKAYLLHLATHLDLEVVALIKIGPRGKSAEMTVAGNRGVTCDLTVPSLADGGSLASLIGEAGPASGSSKVFTREEVFASDGTWCDLIPMDSKVTYSFVPVNRLPVPHAPRQGSYAAGDLFVLATSGCEADEDPALALKTVVCASLVALRLGRHKEGSVHEEDCECKRLPGRNGQAGRYGGDRGFSRCEAAAPAMVEKSGGPTQHDMRKERFTVLSRFMSSIAHEIKNPLTGIAAGVQYLSKKLQPGSTEDETVEFVLAEISRLNRIVDDLYRIAKPPELFLAKTSINDVVGKSLLCLSEEILKKRISIEQDIEKDIPEFDADADRLQQVLINIMKNAVEASYENGRIVIQTAREGSSVVVRVMDRGPGVPAEDAERIFEPFYSTKQGGTGLGLCICQRIIDQHGGRIHVETPEDCGTTFVIELPLRG